VIPIVGSAVRRSIFVLGLVLSLTEPIRAQVPNAPKFRIARAEHPHVFKARSPVKPITYGAWPSSRSPQDFCDNRGVLAVVVVKSDDILFECYRGKVTEATPLRAFSMTKSVVGMTMGLVVQDGKIRALSDRAEDYVAGLKGSYFGTQTIKNLLQMSAGCCASSPADPEGVAGQMSREAWFGAGTIAFVRKLSDRQYDPGTKFLYFGPVSATLTHVMQEALGSPLRDYFESRVWRPMGAQHDAFWTHDTTGVPTGHVGLLATARDMSRFGLMVARGGIAGGKRILPAEWVKTATSVAADDPHLRPGAVTLNGMDVGYGYQTWVLPGNRGQFMMVGLGFQRVAADPQTEVVVTVFSNPAVTIRGRLVGGYATEFQELFNALVSQAQKGEL